MGDPSYCHSHRWTGDQTESVSDEIQGELAVVTRDITPAAPGEISYQRAGRELRVRAQALTAKPLAAGVEVVIDRIENGIAFVEEWSVVEQRI